MSERSLGPLALVGLLVLVVVDVLLIALAFRPDAAGAPTTAATAASTSVSAPAVATSSPTTSAPPSAEPAPVQDVIAAVDGKRAWRATLGSCRDGGASLSVTSDGGRTWTKRTAPARALGRIQPLATTRGFVIGANDGACTVGEYSTGDNAAAWRGSRPVAGGWSRIPGGDPTAVITPQRPDARPCQTTTVVDLARVSATTAVVVCMDGRLVRSADGGTTWSTLATVKGALAVGAREVGGAASVYVARVADGCAGVELAQVTNGPAIRVACVSTSLAGAAGRVSLSVVADAGWLGVAGTTWRSDATLQTWRPTV